MLPLSLFAQSTSKWLRVQSNLEQNFAGKKIKLNGSYLSIQIQQARIYNKSDWYTTLVGRNRQAFIAAEVTANYPGAVNFTDRRSSDATNIKKSKQPVDIGWGHNIIEFIPTSFTKLNLKVTLNSTAKDGVDDVIKVASAVSQSAPPLTIAQSTLGVITGAKQILDQVFNKSLAQTYLTSDYDLSPLSIFSEQPGYYVSFGADVATQYQQYTNDPSKLSWDGQNLKFNNNFINDATYFVILIESRDEYFEKKDFSILSSNQTPWASLYQDSFNCISQVISKPTYDTQLANIRNNLLNAKVFLDKDNGYLQSEKIEINDALKAIVQTSLDKRVKDLGLTLSPVTPPVILPAASTTVLNDSSPVIKDLSPIITERPSILIDKTIILPR